MVSQIKVPALGESVTEATIAKLHKNIGDFVVADELIAELETDKVTLEVNSSVSGVITELLVKEGQSVKVNDVIASIKEGATAYSAAPIQVALPVVSSIPVSDSAKIASPAASKIAKDKGVNLADISGSGRDGRITKGDVLCTAVVPVEMSGVCNSGPREERVKMSRLRQRIAQRLKDSQNTAAILTTFNEVDMSNILRIRAKYKDLFEKKHGVKLGFMSFFAKASIAALKEIPSVNAEINVDEIIYKNYYDIGVAVGTEQGLVVPIIRDADMLSFADVEKTIGAYGKKARDGKLTMQELTGGTFTISNGGVYGSLLSTPIINPPQSAILGMHKTQERPVVVDGKIEIRPMMYLALSYDHRIVDGKEAVTFLVKIKEAIEDPERLLFEL